MNIAQLATVLLLARGAAAPQLEASVGIGAGYDSNVDLAGSRSNVAAAGSSTLSAWADAGVSLEASPTTRVYGGVRYDGVACPDAADLSHHTPGLDVSVTQEVTDWLAIIVTPGVGYAFYGDPARNSLKLSGRAVVRARPRPWLSIRAGYARAQSWASDPVFSLGVDRLITGVEVKAARRTYLALGYSFTSGGEVFYQPVSAAGGRGASRRGSGVFSELVPYQASATEHGVSPRLEQGLWNELYVTLNYEYMVGSSQEGRYVVHSVFGGLGYRL